MILNTLFATLRRSVRRLLGGVDDRAELLETLRAALARGIVDAAGALGAPAIIGSMQGRSSPALPREQALERLATDGAGGTDHSDHARLRRIGGARGHWCGPTR